MKKTLLPFLLLAFSCSFRQDYDRAKAALALANHSYYPISSQQAGEIASDISKIRSIDSNAGLVSYKSIKNDKPLPRPPQYPVIFSAENGKMYAAKVFDFSVAYEAGLKGGCEILKIDGRPVSDFAGNFKSVSDLMEKGKDFICEYSCGSSSPASVQIRKELAYFPFVWSMPVSQDTAYVRINTFSRLSASYVKNNITNLSRAGKKKLIIDLRGINGGDYKEAASFLNLFIEKGAVLFETKSDKQGYAKVFSAENELSFSGFKLAVLINSSTASLGEISAAALKEKAGAVLVGEKTAGKFFITKIFKVGAENGLRLTVAKLALPGKDLTEGLTPDIPASGFHSSRDYVFRLPFFTGDDGALTAALDYLSKLD